jgi:hypothetical protein
MYDPDLLGQIRSNKSDPNPDPDVADKISILIFYHDLILYNTQVKVFGENIVQIHV